MATLKQQGYIIYKINIAFQNSTSPYISLKANKVALIKFNKKYIE